MKKKYLFTIAFLLIASFTYSQNHGFLGKKTIIGVDPVSYFFNKRIDFTLGRIFGKSTYELRGGIQPENTQVFKLGEFDGSGTGLPPSITSGNLKNSGYYFGFDYKHYLSSSGPFTKAPFGAFYGGGLGLDISQGIVSFENWSQEYKFERYSLFIYTSTGYGFRFGKSLLVEPSIVAGYGGQINTFSQFEFPSVAEISPNPLKLFIENRFVELQARLKIALLL